MDWAFLQEVFWALLQGLWVTVVLLVTSMVIGNLLAVPVAIARVSANPLLRVPAYTYILFMRGTPLLVQMFMIYYGLGQFEFVRSSILWPVLREPLWCGIIALSINTAAYSGEILRGAIQKVPKGLNEGAAALGLTYSQTMRTVTLPIAIRYCLPSLSNETILLLKATAITFTITMEDIMGKANIICSQTFRTYEPLLMAALFYLILTFILVRLFRWFEERMGDRIGLGEDKDDDAEKEDAKGLPTELGGIMRR